MVCILINALLFILIINNLFFERSIPSQINFTIGILLCMIVVFLIGGF